MKKTGCVIYSCLLIHYVFFQLASAQLPFIPQKYIDKIQSKVDNLDAQLNKKTEKYLNRLAKAEKKLFKKIQKKQSAATHLLPVDSAAYAQLTNKIKFASVEPGLHLSGEYLPNIDSLNGSLAFLDKYKNLLPTKDLKNKIGLSYDKVQLLQQKFQYADQAKQYIEMRKAQMKAYVKEYIANGQLSKGILRQFKNWNKQAYYYTAQIEEYKNIFNDPAKFEKKILELLNQLPAFKDFMKQNAQLAGLFNLPADYGSPAALQGLQTRDQVNQMIRSAVASGGPGAGQVLNQNLQSAQEQFNSLRNKILNSSSFGGGKEEAMPDFKPNHQKTKSFLKRLEFGCNLQTSKNTQYFPTTSDLGLSVGYKLNDKSIIGVGASYKIGWGSGWQHIALSAQGASLRSFLDMKLKGSFYASGGYEYNYQPIALAANDWQKSGLIGITKTLNIKNKTFKKTKLQLLWDFLSYQQIPRSEPIKFRVGYNF